MKGEASGGRKKRILLVDDNHDLREFLSRAIRGAGYDVIEAEDGQQAVDLIAAQTFDFLATDIEMPRLGGLSVIARFRNRYPIAPIIAISGADESLHGGNLGGLVGQAGGNCLFHKPFNIMEFLAKIDELIGS